MRRPARNPGILSASQRYPHGAFKFDQSSRVLKTEKEMYNAALDGKKCRIPVAKYRHCFG
jgi:hypothetical protein